MDAYVDKCRMCLSDGADGRSIFAQGEKENYSEVILKIFQIKLDQLDNWPSNACGDCIRVMDSIVDLKMKVYSAQEHLGRIALEAQTVKLKDEVVEEDDMATSHDYQEEVLEDQEETVKMECEEPSDDIPKPEPDEFNQRSRRSSRVKKEVIRRPPRPTKEDILLKKQLQEEQKQLQKIKREEKIAAKRLIGVKHRKEYGKLTSMMKEMNLLNCQECLIEFDSVATLQIHTEKVHKKLECYVVCCDRKVYRKSVYDHMKYHLDKTLYTCKICDIQFPCNKTLAHHKRYKHGTNAHLICEHCGKKCASRSSHANHLISHIPLEEREFKYECTMCDKKYALQSSFRIHMTDSHPTSGLSFVCDKCGKAHPSKSKLNQHFKEAHSDKKEVMQKCDLCQNEKYYSIKNLYYHKRVMHRTPVMATCELCGVHGTHKNIKAHYRRHHMGQKFTCDICPKDFNLLETYKVHMNKHKGIKSKCFYCPFEASDSANRVKHMRAKHPKEFEERLAERRTNAVPMTTN